MQILASVVLAAEVPEEPKDNFFWTSTQCHFLLHHFASLLHHLYFSLNLFPAHLL